MLLLMIFKEELTTMNPEVLLQVVLVLKGLATLGAFELAVAGCLVEKLVL